MKEAIEALTALRDRVQGALDTLQGRTGFQPDIVPEPVRDAFEIMKDRLAIKQAKTERKKRIQTTAGTEARLAGLRKYHRKRRAEKARLERLRKY